MKKSLLLVLLIISQQICVTAQEINEKAYSLADSAVYLMDKGKIDDAITLLEQAKQIDKRYNYTFDYEIAYAYELKGEREKAINILERIIKSDDANENGFQLLGNLYDMSKQSEKALLTYNEGLRKFPNSGKLYLELGNVQLQHKNYNEAIEYYEKGVKADPEFPSNYYRLALLFLNSDEEVWGMMYGEIFINLESKTKRTAEISKALFDTYKSQLKMEGDTSLSISFTKAGNYIDAKEAGKPDFRMPFSTYVYETCIGTAAAVTGNLDYEGFCSVREHFIDMFYERELNKQYDNILFSYQKRIKDAGHLEAYNHWVLIAGDLKSFNAWHANHEEEFKKFVDWYNDNPIEINSRNIFLRRNFL